MYKGRRTFPEAVTARSKHIATQCQHSITLGRIPPFSLVLKTEGRPNFENMTSRSKALGNLTRTRTTENIDKQ
jgi:hypothetical protein